MIFVFYEIPKRKFGQFRMNADVSNIDINIAKSTNDLDSALKNYLKAEESEQNFLQHSNEQKSPLMERRKTSV